MSFNFDLQKFGLIAGNDEGLNPWTPEKAQLVYDRAKFARINQLKAQMQRLLHKIEFALGEHKRFKLLSRGTYKGSNKGLWSSWAEDMYRSIGASTRKLDKLGKELQSLKAE